MEGGTRKERKGEELKTEEEKLPIEKRAKAERNFNKSLTALLDGEVLLQATLLLDVSGQIDYEGYIEDVRDSLISKGYDVVSHTPLTKTLYSISFKPYREGKKHA